MRRLRRTEPLDRDFDWSADVRDRRPLSRYGTGQESASETLVLILEMIEHLGDPAEEDNPFSLLLYHRYEVNLRCSRCGGGGSNFDVSTQFNLFRPTAPSTPEGFGRSIMYETTRLEGYRCGICGARTEGVRQSLLRMVPEIIVCLFNIYGPRRRTNYFPDRFSLPGRDRGTKLMYRLVAQVEQVGHLAGGHYLARVLRGDGNVYLCDDAAVSLSGFAPGPGVYIVFYHYERTVADEDAGSGLMTTGRK
jgi:hypothetical protein